MPNTVKRRVTNTQLIYFWILDLFHPTYSGELKISPSILLWLSDLGLRCPFFFPFILLHLFIYLFIVILQKMTYISLWFSLLYRVCSILIQYNKSLFIQRVIRYLQTYQSLLKSTLHLINSFLINLSSAVWSDWCILTNCSLICSPYI